MRVRCEDTGEQTIIARQTDRNSCPVGGCYKSSETVRLFLESIDTDKSGTIGAQELLAALENSNIKVKH
ncbi:hypothetical protein ACTXT7_013917 [Hymenolepis weldensis]